MKNAFKNTSLASAILMAAVVANTAWADVWTVSAGASTDQGRLALAFLSNELWIHSHDSIQWTFATGEIHTVSFLRIGQIRPPLFSPSGMFVGCPGATPDGSMVDGSSCVTSAPSTNGQTYTVNFPVTGNFKLVCLVHARMTGAIHVLDPSAPLPHDQAFYDRQAQREREELLSDASGLEGPARTAAQETSPHGITAGIATISGAGAGTQVAAIVRFLGPAAIIRVGDTVEWTNLAPTMFHTVTFGPEPPNLVPPSPQFPLDADGVRHAVIHSTSDILNSGFLGSPNQETVNVPETPLDFTRFRATFTAPGTYNYICALHDNLGMVGTVVVLP